MAIAPSNDIMFVEIFLQLFSKSEKCCRAAVIFSVPERVLLKHFPEVIS